jgi:hypothetical protein
MSGWARIRGIYPSLRSIVSQLIFTLSTDTILTSKWNKPFPVTLLPSAIGVYFAVYFAEKQSERQRQILEEIRALGENDIAAVKAIASKPR